MGITIHYKGTLSDVDAVHALMSEVEDICKIMKWKYQILDDDWSRPVSVSWRPQGHGSTITGNAGLKGISFQPHKDCEWVDFYFDKNGHLSSPLAKALESGNCGNEREFSWHSTKTQFAPLTIHIAIVKLLKHIKKKYVSDLEVHDEGEYWETGDTSLLSSRINTIFKAMDTLEKGLKNINKKPAPDAAPDDFADYIENLFRSMGPADGESGE